VLRLGVSSESGNIPVQEVTECYSEQGNITKNKLHTPRTMVKQIHPYSLRVTELALFHYERVSTHSYLKMNASATLQIVGSIGVGNNKKQDAHT
jgi:hypothetical protein